MAGWENISEEDIHVEKVEEILDTNPDLYKQRTIAALNEKRYKDALKEAQLALRYGNQALEYHVLIVRVLFEMKQYEVCIKYLHTSGLWDKKDSEELLNDELNYVYYVYACCYRECGYSVNNLSTIIISSDGTGMISTLKEAIKVARNIKTILLTAGEYEEDEIVLKNTNIEISAVKNQKVLLKNILFKVHNSNIHLSHLRLVNAKLKEDDYIIVAENGTKILMDNVEIIGNKNELNGGVVVRGGNVDIHKCVIKSGVGVGVESGIANIVESSFKNNTLGVAVMSEQQDTPKLYIQNCTMKEILGEYAIGILVGPRGYAKVEACTVTDSHIGIGIRGDIEKNNASRIEVSDCTLHCNFINVSVTDGGEAFVSNSTISGASSCGYVVENAKLNIYHCILKHNKQEKYTNSNAIIREGDITREDNNSVGSTIEDVKGGFKNFAKMAWGENYTVSSAVKDTLEDTVEFIGDIFGKLFK